MIRDAVRERYGDIARGGKAGCDCEPSACGEGVAANAETCNAQSSQMGYSTAELASVPAGANMGLGCGNPQAIAAIRSGETVLDEFIQEWAPGRKLEEYIQSATIEARKRAAC